MIIVYFRRPNTVGEVFKKEFDSAVDADAFIDTSIDSLIAKGWDFSPLHDSMPDNYLEGTHPDKADSLLIYKVNLDDADTGEEEYEADIGEEEYEEEYGGES